MTHCAIKKLLSRDEQLRRGGILVEKYQRVFKAPSGRHIKYIAPMWLNEFMKYVFLPIFRHSVAEK